MIKKARKFLFVCTGNTCRSPMAEHMLLKLARDKGLLWSAHSAGTHASIGTPLSRGAQMALEARGIGHVSHAARLLDAALIGEAEAIYAMTRAHCREVLDRFPEAVSKTFVLREATGLSPADVADPIGGSPAAYESCAAAIEEALRVIVQGQNP